MTVAYYDRVSVRPKPAGEPAVDRTDPPVATTTPGALPGATVASQRVTTVTITGWDPALRVVTFTGPAGAIYTRRLLDTTDANIMAGLKVGDRVDVTRTEAVSLAVESRTQVQVAATSRPSGSLDVLGPMGMGQPVQRQHDSGGHRGHDHRRADQHERHDLRRRVRPHGDLKIGAGYRITPRTEVVFNFVYSKSAAETVSHRHRGRGQRAAVRELR